jgi:hypothetical protein
MLDVHPPEHGIHGVRDFFLHLLTITAGLLIAIALEQSVEALHHHHQREQAEAIIRQELRENRADVLTLQGHLHDEIKDLVAVLVYIDGREQHTRPDSSKLKFGFTEGPLRDAAWRTTTATGVAAYMEYATTEKFAECYKEQEQFELVEEHALEAYLNLESFVAIKKPDDLSDDDIRAAKPLVRQALADIGALRDVGTGVLHVYDEALK